MSDPARAWRDRVLLLKVAADAGLDVPLPGEGLRVGRAGSPVEARLWMEETPCLEVRPAWLARAAGLGEGAQRVESLGALSEALARVAREAARAPDEATLAAREALDTLQHLPAQTEVERQIRARVGQDLFRRLLLRAAGARCAVTGLTHPRLLRASHIKPWAECTTDAERLDPENGLLLAAHLDAAFDAFLVSFDREGRIVFSEGLAQADREALGLRAGMGIGAVSEGRWGYLVGHLGRTRGGGG